MSAASGLQTLFTTSTLLLFWALTAIICTNDDDDHHHRMLAIHDEWMSLHGWKYEDAAEKERRFHIFKQNVAFIQSFNSQNHSYKMKVNKFADRTSQEFGQRYLRTGQNHSHFGSKWSLLSHDDDYPAFFDPSTVKNVPKSIDWRELGAVTSIKDQGDCDSCWAFTTVAVLEGITKQTTGRLMSLSAQHLIDCDTENQGCEMGDVQTALAFVRRNGVVSEEDYPFGGKTSRCDKKRLQSAKNTFSINCILRVPFENEAALMAAVSQQPVTAQVTASPEFEMFYGGGVFDGPCGTDERDHAVVIVGYGTTDDGVDYWLLKNSWGVEWGEEGYMKILRNNEDRHGTCGVAVYGLLPVACRDSFSCSSNCRCC